MKKLLILKAGSTFKEIINSFGDFEDWILEGMNLEPYQASVFPLYSNENLPNPNSFRGIIITGSHNDVTEHLPWMESFIGWAKNLPGTNIPVLGICFGHQLLAHSFGGSIEFNQKGREFGMVDIHLTREGEQDFLLGKFPRDFVGPTNHSQTIAHLPDGAITLGFSDIENCHAFRFGNKIWGVQFHPEYTSEIMQAQLDYEKKNFPNRKLPHSATNATSTYQDYGRTLFVKFKEICNL